MRKKVDIITISFFIVTLIVLLVNILNNDSGKVFKAILLLIVIVITKLLFSKTFLRKSQIAYYASLIFEFLSIFLANLFSFYNIAYYDKFLHLISGIILALIGLIIYVNLSNLQDYKKDRILCLFPLFFSIAMAGVWEIWEFTTDNLFGLNAQNNSLLDTMTDIICGTVGGIVFVLLIYVWKRRGKIKLISNIIQNK